ncbi:MAG: hypothetical protein QW051_04645 [Candidatus Aenigmatarchaeota archaeon]
MKKIALIVFFIIFLDMSTLLASNIPIIETMKITVLPIVNQERVEKSFTEALYNLLLEQLTLLNRFIIFDRNSIGYLTNEKNLSEQGIIDDIRAGKFGSSDYVIVPVLAKYSESLSLAIKVHSVQDGRLLATRNIVLDTSSYLPYINGKKIMKALREIFPIAAYVYEISDRQVILGNTDAKLFTPGMLLKIEPSNAVLEITEVDSEKNRIIAKMLNNQKLTIGNIALEIDKSEYEPENVKNAKIEDKSFEYALKFLHMGLGASLVNEKLYPLFFLWADFGITPYYLYTGPFFPNDFDPYESLHSLGISLKVVNISGLNLFLGGGFFQKRINESWSKSTSFSGINSILLIEYEAVPNAFGVNFSWIYGKDLNYYSLGIQLEGMGIIALLILMMI